MTYDKYPTCKPCQALWREMEPDEPTAHCTNEPNTYKLDGITHVMPDKPCNWCNTDGYGSGCTALDDEGLCEACWLSTK